MPENFTGRIGEMPKKPTDSKFFEVKEQQDGALIIKLKPDKSDVPWYRGNAYEFKGQLITLVESKQPGRLIVKLNWLDIGDETIGAIFFAIRKSSNEGLILREVSEMTKNKLKTFGFDKVLTIDDNV